MFDVVCNNDYIQESIDYALIVPVVDYSNFREDAENIRALKFNPAGAGTVPVYDYPDGVVPADDSVTEELVLLRSGKLDKAEIDELKDKIVKDELANNDKVHSDKVSKAVDKVLGVDSESSTTA